MTQIPSEDEIRQAYAPLNVDHDRLREELLAKLPERVVTAQSRFPLTRSRWLAIAASVCIAVPLLSWLSYVAMSPRPAYALEGVHERLLKVRSLHVKGWTYAVVPDDESPDKEKTLQLPLEWYAERPSRYWHTISGVSSDRDGVRITSGRIAADSEQTILVSENQKQLTIARADALATEVKAEWFLQSVWARQLVNGSTGAYRLIEKDEIGGHETLRYERLDDFPGGQIRHVIWLNPRTGLPVRCAMHFIDKMGRERPAVLLEAVEINVPPLAHMFSQEPTEGYKVVHVEKAVAEQNDSPFFSGGAAGSNTHRRDSVAILHGFAVDNRAILACWHHHTERITPEDEEPAPIVPKVESSASGLHRDWDLHQLATQTIRGKDWQWSLIVPRDRRPLDTADSLNLIFNVPSSQRDQVTLSLEAFPLRFNEEKLTKILARIQQPESSGRVPIPNEMAVTLPRLRARIAEIFSRPAGNPSP